MENRRDSYSEMYRQRNKEIFHIKEEIWKKKIPDEKDKPIEKKIIRPIESKPLPTIRYIDREIIPVNIKKENFNKKTKNWIFFAILLLILIAGIFILRNQIIYNFSIVAAVVIILLAAGFLFITITNKMYQEYIQNMNPYLAVIIGYAIILIDMILGARLYSIEWAFLGFILISVLFYDAKIDSRFLILPALLILGYVPFLLIAKNNALAETMAIYVFYFLVVGVFMQFFENYKNQENSIDFEDFFKKSVFNWKWQNVLIVLGLSVILIIIFNRFYNLEFYKWTFLYVFSVCFVIYLISLTIEK